MSRPLPLRVATTLVALASTASWQLRAQVVGDGRDRFTLLDRHLLNRQLFEQIDDDRQAFRLGRNLDPLALAADGSIGTQQTLDGAPQSRFHGFYQLDTFAAARPIHGVDVNLNLVLLNPSASDGYRVSSQLRAGAALHLYYDLEVAEGERVRLDLLGTDLGPVTLGSGLLLEQTRGEGEMASIRYAGLELRQTFIGRVFWPRDDIISLSLGAFRSKAQLTFVEWLVAETDTPGYFLTDPPSAEAGPRRRAHYLSASVDWPFAKRLRAAAEYSARLRDGSVLSAALLRGDFLEERLFGMALHAGYQFRYYQRGFGPRGRLDPPTVTDNRPDREDEYVTNPFEYYGISEAFDQWSHTVMLEARVPIPLPIEPRFGLVMEGEYLHRFASAGDSPERVVYLPGGSYAPGHFGHLYYRAGLALEPWRGLPHRLGGFVTNKQVKSMESISEPVPERFDDGTYFLLQMEAFL